MVDIEFGTFDLSRLPAQFPGPISPDAVEYFSDAIPSVQIKCGDCSLLGTGDVIEESCNLVPGCRVTRFGFLPVGRTSGGDLYVLNSESGKVYELSHEKYNESSISPGWKSDFSGFLPDVPITRENVISTSAGTFESIGHFLQYLTQL